MVTCLTGVCSALLTWYKMEEKMLATNSGVVSNWFTDVPRRWSKDLTRSKRLCCLAEAGVGCISF